jgi:hypothetical protein
MSAEAVENPFAGQGSVLLDIGDDVGALVVTMPAAMVGEEVDIDEHHSGPDRGPGHEHDHRGKHHHRRPHVAVVARPVAGGTVPSLVYPELVEGTYHLMCKDTDDVRLTVRIRGGEVTTVDWPE